MNAARCLAAILLFGCGTPHPNGALAPGDEIAIDVRSSVSAELVTRRVGPVATPDTTTDFTVGCARAMAEMVIAAPLVILIFVAAPPVLLVCPLGGIVADTAVTLAHQRPASVEEVLSQAIAAEVAERDFATRFQESLDARLATQFRVVVNRTMADGVIHARLDALEVVEFDGDVFALRFDGSARVERSGQRGPDRWKRFIVETPIRSYDGWTESDGDLLLADIDAGIDALAQAMAASATRDPLAR
jgi:hypothetical protein